MHTLSSVLAFMFLVWFVAFIARAALTEAPLARCGQCHAAFDSLPAFRSHAIAGCEQ